MGVITLLQENTSLKPPNYSTYSRDESSMFVGVKYLQKINTNMKLATELLQISRMEECWQLSIKIYTQISLESWNL